MLRDKLKSKARGEARKSLKCFKPIGWILSQPMALVGSRSANISYTSASVI